MAGGAAAVLVASRVAAAAPEWPGSCTAAAQT